MSHQREVPLYGGVHNRCTATPWIILPGLLITFYTTSLHAASLFSDNFSNEAQSNQNWVAVCSDDRPLKFSQGAAVLENSSADNVAFAMHTLRPKPSAMSFCCRIVSDLPGAGVFYCADKTGGSYRGYAVIVGDGTLLLLEYGEKGEVPLIERKCPFLLRGMNLIAVSGRDSRIRVFCNGYFQFSFDNKFGVASDIAVLAPPASSVVFDDVTVVDTVSDSTVFPLFADPLTAAGSGGWTLGGSGNEVRSSAGLLVSTTALQAWFGGVVVPIADCRVSVAVQRAASGGDGSVGLVLATGGGDTAAFSTGLRFGITGDGRYTIKNYSTPDSFVVLAEGLTATNIPGGWDTLCVSRRDTAITFTINAASFTVSNDPARRYSGAGLYATGKNSVTFRGFSLADHYDAPVHLRRGGVLRSVVVKSVPAAASFDLLGRVVAFPPGRLMHYRGMCRGIIVYGDYGAEIFGIQKK